MVSALDYKVARTVMDAGNRVRVETAGSDPLVVLSGEAAAVFTALFSHREFAADADPQSVLIPLTFASTAMAGSLVVQGNAGGSSFALAYPALPTLLAAFSKLVDQGINLEPCLLSVWLERVRLYCVDNPEARLAWAEEAQVDHAEGLIDGVEDDASRVTVDTMCGTTWEEVVGPESQSLCSALGLRYRLGEFYRTDARTDGYDDRLESLFEEKAPGNGRLPRRAKMAWVGAIAVVPPACLARLENLFGDDLAWSAFLRYNALHKEDKVALWFARRPDFMGEFPLLSASVEVCEASAALEALSTFANVLLEDKEGYPSLASFRQMEAKLVASAPLLHEANLNVGSLTAQVAFLINKKTSRPKAGVFPGPVDVEGTGTFGDQKGSDYFDGRAFLAAIAALQVAPHREGNLLENLMVVAIQHDSLPVMQHVLGVKDHSKEHTFLAQIRSSCLGIFGADHLAPFSRVLVRQLYEGRGGLQEALAKVQPVRPGPQLFTPASAASRRLSSLQLSGKFLENLLKGADFGTLEWENELVIKPKRALDGKHRAISIAKDATFTDPDVLRELSLVICGTPASGVKPAVIGLFPSVLGFGNVKTMEEAFDLAIFALKAAVGTKFQVQVQEKVRAHIQAAFKAAGAHRAAFWGSKVPYAEMASSISLSEDTFDSLDRTLTRLQHFIDDADSDDEPVSDRKRKDPPPSGSDDDGESPISPLSPFSLAVPH